MTTIRTEGTLPTEEQLWHLYFGGRFDEPVCAVVYKHEAKALLADLRAARAVIRDAAAALSTLQLNGYDDDLAAAVTFARHTHGQPFTVNSQSRFVAERLALVALYEAAKGAGDDE